VTAIFQHDVSHQSQDIY